jgi:hypothetical protein
LLRVPSTLFLILQLASNIEMLRPYAISPVRASARCAGIYQLSLRLGRSKTKNSAQNSHLLLIQVRSNPLRGFWVFQQYQERGR